MSTIIMGMTLPNKPTICVDNFATKYPNLRRAFPVSCRRRQSSAVKLSANTACTDELQSTRRSGNYEPTLWDFDRIQSLNSVCTERDGRRAAVLIKEVKMLLQEEVDGVLRQLELIDALQRLGISCHFNEEIKQILNSFYYNEFNDAIVAEERDLYFTALAFRLLRQHGFNVSQEVFDYFKSEEGIDDFKTIHAEDTKGLLQLYEASFLSTQGEETLELAREYALKFLQKILDHEIINDENLSSSILRDAIKIPIHWRVQMPNARSYIDAYERKPRMHPIVLELAKLEITIVQARVQQELKETSRWWHSTSLVQQLPLVRDRIVECYYWTTGVLERREHGYERIMLTKINALVTTIDDIYDIYGTFEELQLFTNAIKRWDIESMNQLPPYMQQCYLALQNFVNEMAYNTLKQKGFNSIPYLHKTWVDLVEAYMREAEWYRNGHKPSLEEYMNNAWISIGGVPILSHIFFCVTDSIDEVTVERVHEYHDIARASCTILRLADDLGTSLDEVKRGDVPKSVECYMNDEKNASEQEARAHVRSIIKNTWKTMNEEMMTSTNSQFSKYFVEAAANLGRMSLCIYQDECDGFGMQHSRVNKMLRGLLFDPCI
nr:terpene synthase [Mentha x piperita]